MVAPYPYPTNEQVGFYGLSEYLANVTEGWLFLMFVFIIWVVVFTNTKAYSTSRAFFMANLVSGVGAIILAVLNLIAPQWAYLLIILAAAGLLWIKFEG